METFKYAGPVRIVEKTDLEAMVQKVDRIEASLEPGAMEVALKGLSMAVLAGSAMYFLTRPTDAHAMVRAAREAAITRENENLSAELADLKRRMGDA